MRMLNDLYQNQRAMRAMRQAAIQRGVVAEVTVAWLMGIARHKVVDHWRRVEREQRRLAAVEGELSDELDPWDPVIDQQHAEAVLAALRPNHRLVLTLKYLDGLPVAEIADASEAPAKHASATPRVRVLRNLAYASCISETGPRSCKSTQ